MLRGKGFKNYIALFVDACGIILSFWLALYIRLGDRVFLLEISNFTYPLMIFLTIALISNIYFAIYRSIWRYFSIDILRQIIISSSITILVFLLVYFINARLESFPRAVVIITWFLLITFQVLPRALYRSFHEEDFSFLTKLEDVERHPALIIGLSSSTANFIDEIQKNKRSLYEVIGVIDERSNVGRIFNRVPILGTLEDIKKVIKKLENKNKRPTKILINSEFYIGGKLNEILEISEELSIPIARIPRVTELNTNQSGKLPIKAISVEELLGRNQRDIDHKAISKMIKGKRIMVTGAGGSIGSEIARQVLKHEPKALCILDYSEYLLYEIQQELDFNRTNEKVHACLTDIKSIAALDEVFAEYKPDIVFHAAALKHVPLLEDHKIEAIETNVIGTKNILDSAIKHKAERFVLISTDKAVDPTSFMGSTKRMAELYSGLSKNKGIIISIVRFGNVLGSNGSVVPLFEKQISMGGPITVTDASTTRYFMTIPEAVGLVMQAATISDNHEHVSTFVLDMGEPMKIIELARQMILLAGFKPDIDIKIKIIGMRPGEKLHEILVTENESLIRTKYKDIFLANVVKIDSVKIKKAFVEIINAIKDRDRKTVIKIVKKILA